MTFSQDISRFIDKTGLKANLVLRKLSLEGFQGVVKRSPVDTGRFRASNRLGVNRADLSVEPERAEHTDLLPQSPPTGQENGYAISNLVRAKWGDTIRITNNLPYAPPIENGSSTQAPAGVYRQTLEELKANVERIVRSVAR